MRPFMRRCIEEASRIGRVLAHSADRYFADSCPQHAAGIAYRVLFSIVPLAIVLVSIFGVILGNEAVHDAVVDTIVGALPSTAASREDVADAITGIATPSGAVGLVTLVAVRMGGDRDDGLDPGGPRGRDPREADASDGARQAGRPGARGRRGRARARQPSRRRCSTAWPSTRFGGWTRPRAWRARSSATGCRASWRSRRRSGSSCCSTGSSPAAGLRRADALAGAVTTVGAPARHLGRLEPALRRRDAPERRLRLADGRARLPLLGLPVRVRAALRR